MHPQPFSPLKLHDQHDLFPAVIVIKMVNSQSYSVLHGSVSRKDQTDRGPGHVWRSKTKKRPISVLYFGLKFFLKKGAKER